MASVFTLPDGRALRYRLAPDEPARPTIVLAGPLATTGAVWDYVAPALHTAGFRTLAYDHPGHGGSAAPAKPTANTFEAMTDDVHALMTAVSPAGVHGWIGCSLGSAAGLVYAARFPGTVARLVVCDTVSSSPVNAGIEDHFTPRVRAIQANPASLAATLATTRGRWLGAEWLAAHPDRQAWLSALMAETTVDGYVACIAALTSAGFDLGKTAPAAAAAVQRVLFVVGAKDAPLTKTMPILADKLRAAGRAPLEFAVVPNAGHTSFIDGFDAWCGVVLPFLK